MSKSDYPVRVGELRPSQLLWAFGPGALVDLPQISVIMLGLDFWKRDESFPISEARLLVAVRQRLGYQVEQLLAPPIRPDSNGQFDPFSAEARIGAPVAPFPTWLRCPVCQVLAEYNSGLFELKSYPYRPDRTQFVHTNCNRANQPTAVPARFLVACRNGHLDDFPWHWFVHRGMSDCRGQLRFYEQGASLQTENLWVECTQCASKRSMAEAFGEQGKKAMPACRGHHPHLGNRSAECDEMLRPVLLGASNSWFPMTLSVLAIPTKEGKLAQLVEDKWPLLEGVPSREVLPHVLKPLIDSGQLPGIKDFSEDEIWDTIAKKKSKDNEGQEDDEDLKIPEWRVFVDPDPKCDWPDFMIRSIDPPKEFSDSISSVLLVERLREVNALLGFTRVDPPEEGVQGQDPPPRAPLCRSDKPQWVPATEVRGEGIFIRFELGRLAEWLKRSPVQERSKALLRGHRAWRAARQLQPLDANFPGILHVLLHTFAHVLLRELSLECGYNTASIRERIYASETDEGPEMAGILLYTAAADSDGTLGGLVELGKPVHLGRLIEQALSRTRICASDPLCAEHVPDERRNHFAWRSLPCVLFRPRDIV